MTTRQFVAVRCASRKRSFGRWCFLSIEPIFWYRFKQTMLHSKIVVVIEERIANKVWSRRLRMWPTCRMDWNGHA